MKFFVTAFVLCGAALCSVSDVNADCTTEEKSSLLSCASNSILTCRNLLPTCTEPAQAISVQDILTATSAKCCAITGKKKEARQRLCVAAVELRYSRAQIGADKTLKGFLRATKLQLSALKKAGCSTGSN